MADYRYYTNKSGDPLSVFIEDTEAQTVLAFFNGDNKCRVLDKTCWNREKIWGVHAATQAEAELMFCFLERSPDCSVKTFPTPERISVLMKGTGLE